MASSLGTVINLLVDPVMNQMIVAKKSGQFVLPREPQCDERR